MSELPVSAVLERLRQALRERHRAVLTAPTGSGKTTLVPLELLGEPWLAGRRILLLEPRRLAARAAAGRMAQLLDERLGETVGYRTRLDSRVSPRTRIEVVTEGILTRQLQRDPELSGVGLVIFDEFHERSLHADLALALTLDVLEGLRDDLRLLVMSATLDAAAVAHLLGEAPVVSAQGRSHPVEIHYLGDPPRERRLVDAVVGAIGQLLEREQGDLLVFLPGVGEIRQGVHRLEERLAPLTDPPLLRPLYGDLSKTQQDQAILPDPGGRRRIVLATSIAETSLTIEGITWVLDSGWSRRPRFLPQTGLSRLETVRVSRAAAQQRAGRAGRLGPGRCYRLWSESRHSGLAATHPPEILEADLAPLLLELLLWGVDGPEALSWLDPPPPGACAQAHELLLALGAVDGRGRLTPLGREMAGLPLHPRLAHMLLRAGSTEARQLACDLAALLEERDILAAATERRGQSDLELRLGLLRQWRQQGRRGADRLGLDESACRRIEQTRRQLGQLLERRPLPRQGVVSDPAGLLALAYPERIARRSHHGRFQLASGRAARLEPEDPLAGAAYLVAARLDAGRSEGRIRLAAGLDESALRALPDLPLEQRESVTWDPASQAVLAQWEERLGAIRLSSRRLHEPPPEQVARAMLEGVRRLGLDALPWSPQAEQWRNRLLCLARWQPEAGWPEPTDAWLLEHLEDWLGPWLNGITRREQLRRLDLSAILRGLLSWQQQQALEQAAPSHLRVPSGSRKRLEYRPGAAPVLAVRLQELFGLRQTPTVCQGRVAVTLHLLSPAQRPIQVTQDLPGFWERTYQEVKKELKGRYPKHYWPDDPYQAQPTARVRPRG